MSARDLSAFLNSQADEVADSMGKTFQMLWEIAATINKVKRSTRAARQIEDRLIEHNDSSPYSEQVRVPMLVIDPQHLEEAEHKVFDAIEAFLKSLGPEDRLKEMPEELRDMYLNMSLGARHTVAERRAEAMEE
jgi:hypothetical protein